ncbi:baseplate J/gp47 family protein [Salmonella enterica]|uniref:ubiquitin-activating E1 FCCH domain-containing protein n=1 Tax=Salmonella TaxID=590 RepID=UPI000B608012|nr:MULTISPECIES: ubiquitin-activating E1 FCCH domain-containing protein [Salmonella]ASN57530.1 baseplate J-like family protein [Salmonella enterica subsp. enterica serovar Indiana]EEJ2275959.1 baseplate J-like family protein [Salmonella enterica subsp. enterica]MBJ5712943.1 baseplate J/gp47 family protein [Salmonella enterica subsp. enterica serovar Indiana]MBJ6087372.1 baseplate J/gp47 family protein [Salmonella enterica subsp. enterica serovar Indiana]MBM8358766.1 baseplate J/gp47 family pro
MSDLSVSYDAAGPVPKTADELRSDLVSRATALSPGITTDLPGSLIEDMASTGTGALLVADQIRVDLINSVGPLKANQYLLNLLAQQSGIPAQKSEGSTTVSVQFTGPSGFVIPQGFLVSDGTYTYALSDATIIPASGVSSLATCEATISGSWAVPAGSVNQILTSLPSDITITCTNPTAGTPGGDAETLYQFRERVWEAQMSTVQGYPGFIRQKLTDVDNVQARLVSVVQDGNSWVVMCGGGDIYEMAGAIYKSAGDISRLKGTTLNVTGITNANPGVVTTGITHGLTTGQTIQISGVTGMSGINGVALTATVISSHTFSIGINTTSSGAWTGGGEVTPNSRNNIVTINDWPDNYLIPFVIPLQQQVTVKFEWATESINYLTDATVSSMVSSPVISYINGIYAGKPLNINSLKDAFLQAVNEVINMSLITTLNVTVTVNGVITPVDVNTNIISGDPYSYWYIASDGVIVDGI